MNKKFKLHIHWIGDPWNPKFIEEFDTIEALNATKNVYANNGYDAPVSSLGIYSFYPAHSLIRFDTIYP